MKKSPLLFAAGAVLIIAIVALIIVATSGKDDNTMADMPSSSSSSTATTPPADAVATNAVSISNYMFGPEVITVKVGTTVTWTNQDPVRHNIASDDNAFEAGKLFSKGETYSYTFDKAGTFKYHCDPHPYMHGTVVVTN